MPGPVPKEGARYPSRDLVAEVRLPRSGRKGRAPRWPLDVAASAGEAKAWRELWRSPQAVAWEQLDVARSVARYVVCLVASEERGAPAALLAEVRQMEDRLGLSPMALLRLRWRIVDDAEVDVVAGRRVSAPSTRGRLRVVG